MFYKYYTNKNVFISGGAGFIGSHLLDALINSKAQTTVGDNLSTGSLTNVFRIWKKYHLKPIKTDYGYRGGNHRFIKIDFQDFPKTIKALKNQNIIFHLAAVIGGRGFINTHPADCCEGFALNHNMVKAACLNNADKVIFASSACAYPTDLQKEYQSQYLLKEADAFKNGWGNADEMYGWAKLMGEEILRAYHTQYGLKGAVTRYVTAYGPWENDTHAVIALIKRAVEKQDPYLVWGSGNQDRDFTFVDDIVSGTLTIGEKINDGAAVNLGTAKRYTIKETIRIIFKILNWQPKKIIFDTNKPEGVKTRALAIQKAKRLGWQPQFDLEQGLEKTIAWYIQANPKSVENL